MMRSSRESVEDNWPYYYVSRIPGFRPRANIAEGLPPERQRANQSRGLPAIEHIMITHTSNPAQACGILKEARIAPSRLRIPDSNSFLSLGARKTGNLDFWELLGGRLRPLEKEVKKDAVHLPAICQPTKGFLTCTWCTFLCCLLTCSLSCSSDGNSHPHSVSPS